MRSYPAKMPSGLYCLKLNWWWLEDLIFSSNTRGIIKEIPNILEKQIHFDFLQPNLTQPIPRLSNYVSPKVSEVPQENKKQARSLQNTKQPLRKKIDLASPNDVPGYFPTYPRTFIPSPLRRQQYRPFSGHLRPGQVRTDLTGSSTACTRSTRLQGVAPVGARNTQTKKFV